ncbi:phosphotransferase enzyme family protein [Burkholderia cenocepacia K56-2Valvano]|uniref:phosphotransferase n=1 Tax=Burkholderia cenocepacia TaxID=95486 RepID=UPI000386579C|nr:phosphotransferase [Burkholderia cenocepacia]EPZ86741.1 phosphotransferase enzyme family protein [Burkholderia cenocepacia K56-2Valvano]
MVNATSRSDVKTLEPWLHRYWNIGPARLQALASGHTNKTYLVEGDAGRAVLRVSWAGKPLGQMQREASILGRLGAARTTAPRLPALPRLQPTVDARTGVRLPDGRWLHLFEHIDGRPGLPDDPHAGATDAMRTLAHLHTALAAIPASEAAPLAWLSARHARVAARAMLSLPGDLNDAYDTVIRRIGAHLDAAAAWLTGPAHWLHGDYHAGNLLYVGNAVNGVLDFDDVGQGAPWLEAAFASFALSRDADRDDGFVFDRGRWGASLDAYAATRPDAAPAWLRDHYDALTTLFCADQTLIHLEAAQRGLWMPGPGIGFLGGWRQLLDGAVPAG